MASEADESSTPVRVRAPIGVRVAANVEALRKARGWSQQQLSDRMAELGRPLIVTAVSKVEQGQRRVDVDDLVALALALDVNPNRLLLSASADDEDVALAPAFSAPAWSAWQWADGEFPIPRTSLEEGLNSAEDYERFLVNARPPAIRRVNNEPLVREVAVLLSRVRRLFLKPQPRDMDLALRAVDRQAERFRFELEAYKDDRDGSST